MYVSLHTSKKRKKRMQTQMLAIDKSYNTSCLSNICLSFPFHPFLVLPDRSVSLPPLNSFFSNHRPPPLLFSIVPAPDLTSPLQDLASQVPAVPECVIPRCQDFVPGCVIPGGPLVATWSCPCDASSCSCELVLPSRPTSLSQLDWKPLWHASHLSHLVINLNFA